MIEDPVWLRQALTDIEIDRLRGLCADGGKPGQRLALNTALRCALQPSTDEIAKIAAGAFPVRAVAFDKTAKTGWTLPWHQDRVIPVARRATVPGYNNWSKKHGIWHCEPPVSVLTKMMFVRIHLDDTNADNGGMEIAHGSHREGIVLSALAESKAKQFPHELCEARAGDILILPMLTLHRSIAAVAPSSRRVLRIDYATSALTPPLAWPN